MAKVISCRDVGVDCDFKARAKSMDELITVLAKHAKDAHGMTQIPPETLAKVKAAVRDE
jgi:predicted small metal-binding protein